MRHKALTLVLLPGMDGTGRLFSHFIPALPPNLYPKLITYPMKAVHTYAELTERVERELPKYHRFAIIAESFSGPIAIRIAANKPRGLKALVLVGSFAENPYPRVPRWAKHLIRPGFFRGPMPATLLKKFLLGSEAGEPLLAEFKRVVRTVAPKVLADRLGQVLLVNRSADFAKVATPILYLRGTRDKLLPKGLTGRMKSCKPEIEIEMLDAPHMMCQTRPKETAAAVAGFFRRLKIWSPD